MNETRSPSLFQAGLAIRFPAMTMEEMTANAHSVGWELHYTPLASAPLRAQPSVVHTANLQLGYTRYGGGTMIEGGIPKEAVLLCFSADAQTVCSYQNRRLAPYEVFLVTDREEIDFLHNGPCTLLTVALNRELFEKRFYEWFGIEWQTCAKEGRLRLEPSKTERFLKRIHRWIGLFFDPACTHCSTPFYERTERELLEAFFEHLAIESAPRRHESRRTLRKARELLHAHADTYYSIAQLADELGVTQRNLQYLFKKHLGLTPKSYWLGVKFRTVREEIRRQGGAINIGELALKHGFYHAGHFSALYKRFFGELPSQTR